MTPYLAYQMSVISNSLLGRSAESHLHDFVFADEEPTTVINKVKALL